MKQKVFVKWKGFDSTQNTWELVSDMRGTASEMLERYLKDKDMAAKIVSIEKQKVTDGMLHYLCVWENDLEESYESWVREADVPPDMMMKWWLT